MANPLVSVIIPVHNRAAILPRAIDSVLKQSYRDLELIVVDDGSNDNIKCVVSNFADGRLVYLRHDINRGVSAARNTGIKAAHGEYIAFLDSDDLWHADKLLKQLSVFAEHPEADCVYSLIRRQDPYGVYVMPIHRADGMIYEKVLRWHCVPVQSLVLRRSCFDTAGFFDEKLLVFEDWDICVSLSKHFCFRMVFEVLAYSQVSSDSASVSLDKVEKSYGRVMDKYADLFKNREILSAFYYFFGYLLCINNKFYDGKKMLFKSFCTDPWDLKKVLALTSLVLGEGFYKMALGLRHRLERVLW